MIRFLLRVVVFFLAAFIGILAADVILGGFSVDSVVDFVWVAGIFAVIQAILAPMIEGGVRRNASALTGGVGLVTTFVALILTSLLTQGLHIDGVGTWIAATVIVWLFTALAAWILPFFVLKKAVDNRRD